jgi:hypothetical protein
LFVTKINGEGYVTYSQPVKGTETGISRRIEGGPNKRPIASIHSHGAYREGYDNNNFSEPGFDSHGNPIQGDTGNYRRIGINGYVTTPNGSLKKWTPYNNGNEVIDCGMPSDENDPEYNPNQEVSSTAGPILQSNN